MTAHLVTNWREKVALHGRLASARNVVFNVAAGFGLKTTPFTETA
jgi:hypothetical protein